MGMTSEGTGELTSVVSWYTFMVEKLGAAAGDAGKGGMRGARTHARQCQSGHR
jgi:hypothetical protein